MEPVPFLIVCDFNGHGGTQTQVLELLGALDRGAWRPRLAALTLDPELARRLAALDVPVTDLALTSAVSPATWRALSSLGAAEVKAGVRLVHGFLFQGNAVAAIVARRAGLPYATSVRNMDLRRAPHELALSRWSHRGARAVTFNSTHVRDLACAREGIPVEKARVIPNGIAWPADPEPPSPDPWPGGASPRLACVASLTAKKGIRHLLEAFAIVVRELPRAALLLAGEGPERATLEAAAVRLGISGRLRFLGRRGDTRGIISSADLLVLSSLEEGMPNVIVEALAAGVPQVATAVGGVGETLEDGGSGYLVPPGDPVMMAERIIRIAAAPERSRAFSERSRTLFSERHAAEALARGHEGLYEVMLGASRGVAGRAA